MVLICSLILSDIWTSLRPKALATQDTVLWHKVLGEGVVKLVLMFPMVFAIVLLEYVAWVFLYIYVDSWVFEKLSYRPQILPLP